MEASTEKEGLSRSSIGADDPFYPREGKSLTWKNVNMTVVSQRRIVRERIICFRFLEILTLYANIFFHSWATEGRKANQF